MPEVTTSHGVVRGRAVTVPGGEVEAYLGIPYAEPPIGHRRFRRTVSSAPWDGVRDATSFGPSAMQVLEGPFAVGLPGLSVSEVDEAECLTVNVWRPAAPSNEPRPVLVWVHGGAYSVGGSSEATYDGARLAAEQDVVVASFNYRLGAFGFADLRSLHGGEHTDTNVGLSDALLALEWIKANAAAFGGDAGRLTAFGESAGGGVIIHLLSSRSAPPFTQAVAMSPGVDMTLTPDLAAGVTAALVEAAGVDGIAGLRALDASALVDAQGRAAMALLFEVGSMPFHPVIDGDLIDATPSTALGGGRGAGIPLMVSSTADELRLFPDPRAAALDDAALTSWTRAELRHRMAADPGDEVAARLLAHYRDTAPAHRRGSAHVWVALLTDGRMRLPVDRLAELHTAAGGRTFQHLWAWQPRVEHDPGAFHAIDLPFAFDALDLHGWDTYLGVDDAARTAGRAFRDALGSFARTGTPRSNGIGDWPEHRLPERSVVVLDDPVHVEPDPLAASRQAWDGLWSPDGTPAPVPR